jgi:hypothetical protein
MPGVSGSQQSPVPLAQGQWGRRPKRILKHALRNTAQGRFCLTFQDIPQDFSLTFMKRLPMGEIRFWKVEKPGDSVCL